MWGEISNCLLIYKKRSSRLSECFALVNFNTYILSDKLIYVNSLAFAIYKDNTLYAVLHT